MTPSPAVDQDALLDLSPPEKRALIDALARSLEGSPEPAARLGASDRSLLETANSASGIGFSTWDLRTGEVVFDGSYHGLLGFEPGELSGSTDAQQERIHPEDRDRVVAARQVCLRGDGARFESLHRERHADGRWLWLREQGTVVRAEDGAAGEIMVRTHFEVTRFKMLEDQLQAISSAQRRILEKGEPFATAFASLLECVLQVTDSEYGYIGEVRYDQGAPYLVTHAITDIAWNEETRKIYREQAPNVEFRNLDNLFGYGIRRREVVISNDCVEDPRAGGVPHGHPPLRTFLGIPLMRGDRMVGQIGVSNRPGGYEEDLVARLEPISATLTTLIDLVQMESERGALERQVERAQKMETLGLLAGGLAHDFNNLLTVILGEAEMLQADLGPHLKPIHRILESSEQAASLCRELLIYAGGGSPQGQAVQVSRLLIDSAQLLEVSVPKRVEIEYQLQSRNDRVVADRAQLQQVLMNLVKNAAEAMAPNPGKITVASESGERPGWTTALGEQRPAGRYLGLKVLDDGPGFDAGNRERVFEPFFSTKGPGRGLGLSTALSILRNHGGDLILTTAPDGRTCFEAVLPLAADEVAEKGSDTELVDRPTQSAGRVLLVDDEEALLATLRDFLVRSGFDLLTARDGREAVEIFQARAAEVDVVLMDIRMPRLGGFEAARVMAEENPSVPVVLMSGYTQESWVPEEHPQNVFTFVHKPFRLSKVQAALSGAIGRAAARA